MLRMAFFFCMLLGFTTVAVAQIDPGKMSKEIKVRVHAVEQGITDSVMQVREIPEKLVPVLDEVSKKLSAEGMAQVDTSLRSYTSHIKLPSLLPVQLGAVAVEIPFLGSTQTYPFSIGKGDTLSLVLDCLTPWAIRRVEVLEGTSVRFSAQKISKKNPLSARIPALESGALAIRIFHRKLALPTRAALRVEQLLKQKTVVVKERADTVYSTEKKMVNRVDTLSELFMDQQFMLAPRLDITTSPSMRLQVSFPKSEQVLGWAYWVGVGANSLKQFDAESAKVPQWSSALEAYARGKLRRLPESKIADVEYGFFSARQSEVFLRGGKATPYPLRSTTSSSSAFAFIPNAPTKYAGNPLYFAARNASSLYDYPLFLKGMILTTVVTPEEIEVQVPQIRRYLEVSLREE